MITKNGLSSLGSISALIFCLFFCINFKATAKSPENITIINTTAPNRVNLPDSVNNYYQNGPSDESGGFAFNSPLEVITPTTITEDPLQGLSPPENSICSEIWDAYPEADIPEWLYTPESPQGLATDVPYVFLAGHVIVAGLVKAGDCPNNGLFENGSANSCGLERARDVVRFWQNQFDKTIWIAAVKNAIPAVLFKRILAFENQFWFGPSLDYTHFGSGQITEAGLDPLFIYYPNYYYETCSSIFSPENCTGEYEHLSSTQRAMIRGYFLVNRIDASCINCPAWTDFTKAYASIDIIAKLVVANCQQVNQMINNVTSTRAGRVSTYEDLWKITLVNFNAGSGCTALALKSAHREYNYLSWENVLNELSQNCTLSIDYVTNITQ